MGMIEESLKTIRLTHLVIIGVSVAVLSLATSPLSHKYEEPYDEVQFLNGLNFGSFESYAIGATSDSNEAVTQQCKNFLNELPGIIMDDNCQFQPPFYLPHILERHIQLREIRDFFENSRIVFFGFSRDAVQQKWPKSQSYKSLSNSDSTYTVYRFDLLGRGKAGFQGLRMYWYPGGVDSAELFLSFNRTSLKHAWSNIPGYQPELYDSLPPFECLAVDFVAHDFGRNVALDWLRSQPESKYLIRKENGREEVMPKLKVFSEKCEIINSMTISEAKSFLEKKIDETKGKLTFMNVVVKEEVALWLGPLSMLTLLSFFLVHLRHLRSVIKEDLRTLQGFPWVGLYPDRFSKVLTIVTVIFFPIVANIILLLRTGGVLKPLLVWSWGVILLACIVMCSSFSIKTITDLNAINRRQNNSDSMSKDDIC